MEIQLCHNTLKETLFHHKIFWNFFQGSQYPGEAWGPKQGRQHGRGHRRHGRWRLPAGEYKQHFHTNHCVTRDPLLLIRS